MADDRPTCVLLPGMLCDEALFAGQLDTLGAVADVRTMEIIDASMAEAVNRVLDSAPPRFVLVGFSLGGIVALACAIRAPYRVAGLALLSTNAAGPRPQQRGRWRAWRALVAAGAGADAMREATEVMLPPGTDPSLHAAALDMAARVGPGTFDRQLQLLSDRDDLLPHLSRVRATTIVLGGTADPLVRPDRQRRTAAGIADAELTLWPDRGHLVTMEQPAATAGVLRRLVERSGRRAPTSPPAAARPR